MSEAHATRPFSLTAYRLLSRALAPLTGPALLWRAQQGKENASRLGERFGRAARARPDGVVIWLHGASVGETRVLLQVQAGLAKRYPEAFFLFTSGTLTSAELLDAQKNPRIMHQFTPIDRIDVVRRFLRHWRPQLAVFAESEIWPNLIVETHAQSIPLALINARMSVKTLENWRRAPDMARALMQRFSAILTADQRTLAGLHVVLGEKPEFVGNLKLCSPPPLAPPGLLETLRAHIADRPVWLAASTHQGEDEIVLSAHARLMQDFPNALLIIAPRHPERGASIAALAGGAPRRSANDAIGTGPVFVADTIGEMGALYPLASVAFIGGSLAPHLRGHNPIEPAHMKTAILSGPFVESFSEIFDDLVDCGGALITRDADEIAGAVSSLWRHAPTRERQIAQAATIIARGDDAMRRTIAVLETLMAQRVDAAA
jgi:3-deoxy-D-manno-octulosonic-acid transferase